MLRKCKGVILLMLASRYCAEFCCSVSNGTILIGLFKIHQCGLASLVPIIQNIYKAVSIQLVRCNDLFMIVPEYPMQNIGQYR